MWRLCGLLGRDQFGQRSRANFRSGRASTTLDLLRCCAFPHGLAMPLDATRYDGIASILDMTFVFVLSSAYTVCYD